MNQNADKSLYSYRTLYPFTLREAEKLKMHILHSENSEKEKYCSQCLGLLLHTDVQYTNTYYSWKNDIQHDH